MKNLITRGGDKGDKDYEHRRSPHKTQNHRAGSALGPELTNTPTHSTSFPTCHQDTQVSGHTCPISRPLLPHPHGKHELHRRVRVRCMENTRMVMACDSVCRKPGDPCAVLKAPNQRRTAEMAFYTNQSWMPCNYGLLSSSQTLVLGEHPGRLKGCF